MDQTAVAVRMKAEGAEKEMQLTWLGQCFRGRNCQKNRGTGRGIGRRWSG